MTADRMDNWLPLSEIVRNFAIVVAGAVGLGLAAWRGLAASRQSKAAADQAAISRRAHVTELFGKAVSQLGADRLEVRLGAIYMLRRIADDFPDFMPNVLELLVEYVRERATEDRSAPDVRAIVRFLTSKLSEATR
jgi:hypothetical protein